MFVFSVCASGSCVERLIGAERRNPERRRLGLCGERVREPLSQLRDLAGFLVIEGMYVFIEEGLARQRALERQHGRLDS